MAKFLCICPCSFRGGMYRAGLCVRIQYNSPRWPGHRSLDVDRTMATSTTTLSYRCHATRGELELSRFTHYHGCTEQTLKECRTMDMPSTSEYFAPRPATHQDPHTIAAF